MTDAAGARRMQEYLTFVDREARPRFDSGMAVAEAALDIALGEYRNWRDAERIAVNVDALYRGYRGDSSPPDMVHLFGLMARVRREMRR